MTTGKPATAQELIHMLDEQLRGDDEMMARLSQQADEVHTAFDDLLARLRREIDASSSAIPGACHLRG